MQGGSSGPPAHSTAQPHANIFITKCYLFPIFSVPKMRGLGIYLDEQWVFAPTTKVRGIAALSTCDIRC